MPRLTGIGYGEPVTESEPLIQDIVTIDLLFPPNFQEKEDALRRDKKEDSILST